MQNDVKKDPLKIVVVDDSDFSRKNIIKVLEEANFEVVGEPGSAEEALALSQTTSANLYIIDVVMPNSSGIDLAKKFIEFIPHLVILTHCFSLVY